MGSNIHTFQNKVPTIQPTPGIHGGVKRKGYITIYTDHDVFTLKFAAQLQVADLKVFLQDQVGLLFSLYQNHAELDDSLTLSSLNEPAMLKAVLYKPGHTTKNSSYSNTDTGSMSNVQRNPFDLSKYSVPDLGQLKISNSSKTM